MTFVKRLFWKKDLSGISVEDLEAKKRIRLCTAFGFLIPALVMIVAFMVNEVYPVGDRGVLIIDSLHQYLPFFTEFHEKLTNNQTFLYSFGGGLGFNFWATIAYYLASPMNFLLVIFEKIHMMDAMALFIVLKIGLCGATFSWYLAQKENGKSFLPVLFGVMYALSSFVIGYYFNLMWLDSVAMLPLVMMGIERIVRGGSGRLFGISLFYGLYCNYYIGYMLCLFSCLYLLVQWISAKGLTVKKFFASALNFGWYALLSGGMAAIMLVPAFVGLGVTESAENSFPSTWKFYVKDLQQLTSSFSFVEPMTIADNQYEVNAFCGVLALILVVLFLLDQNIRLREKLAKLALLILLYMSFNVNVLNFIWHGFHTQNGLPNRFSFIYIAMLLVMGHQVLWQLREMHWAKILFAVLLPLGFAGYSWYTGLGEWPFYTYLITVILLVIYGVVLVYFGVFKKRCKWFPVVLSAVVIVEMGANGIYGVGMNGTVSRQTYLDDQICFEALMERNESGEDADVFFRTDIDSTRMRNADMFMGGGGVMLFSSTMPAATVDLCKAIGMEARTNKTGYVGVTKLFNDIFGIKYVFSRTNSDSLYQMEQVDYEEPLALYRNDNALSVGFVVDSDVREWNIHSGDHMDVQNQFTALAVDEGPLYALNQTLEMEDGVTYDVVLPAGYQAYLSLESRVSKITIVTPNYNKSYNNYNDYLYDLGCFTEENKATVTCTFKDGQKGPVKANVYICEDAYYEEIHEKLARSQLQVTEAEDGRIRGVIDSHMEGTLLFSIPFDLGWTVKVDGEKVEPYTVGTALMAIDITEGHHAVALDYMAPGMMAGSLLSLMSILLLLATLILENKRGWNRIPEAEEMGNLLNWQEKSLEETSGLLYDESYEIKTGCENGGKSEFVQSVEPDRRQ